MWRYAMLMLVATGTFLGVGIAQYAKLGAEVPTPGLAPPASAPVVAPAGKQVMTEAEWVAGGAEGTSVVELEVHVFRTGGGSGPGQSPNLTLSAEARKLGGQPLFIHVSSAVVEQLRRVGIEEPMDFYLGKVVRVRGTVKAVRHFDNLSANHDAYYVMVEGIDQFVSVRRK